MQMLKIIGLNSIVVLMLVVCAGCGQKEEEARKAQADAELKYALLAADNKRMQDDFSRVTECLRVAQTDGERALCK